MDACEYGWCKNQVMKTLVPVLVTPTVALAPVKVLRLITCGCTSDNPCSTHDFHVQWFVIVNKRLLINAIINTLSVC